MLPMMSAMKRTLEPEDLAGTAVFFASDDAELVTGQTLVRRRRLRHARLTGARPSSNGESSCRK